MEKYRVAGPHQCLGGEEAVQSQLRSSRRNFDTFGQISRAMIERGHDRDAMQFRIKVKELWSAYCKAPEANSRSGAPPTTCRFYKELDAIFRGDPTSIPSTTVDTGEQEEEEEEEGVEESRSEGAGVGGDTPDSLGACSQDLFSSQEEGSQSQRPICGGGEREEQVHDATLRSLRSVLSLAERLQRLRKRPRRTKEDMLQEVMNQSLRIKRLGSGGERKQALSGKRFALAAKHAAPAGKHKGTD
ncbi:uncharacterized protein RBU57_011598 isoform 1-T3 [Macrochelys suwanniensis]